MDDDPRKTRRAPRKKGSARNERIVGATGVAGVVVVAISTCITAYQAIVMRNELKNTVDQQRAWVKVNAIPEAFFSDPKDGGEMMLRVKATNVGSVPAFGVKVGTALWPGPGPHSKIKHNPYGGNENCQRQEAGGTVIFPSETVELFADNATAPASDLRYLADDQNHVSIMVIVCVTYQTGVNEELLRRTVASFAAVKRTGTVVAIDDSKMDASHEAIGSPTLHLIRLGVADEAD